MTIPLSLRFEILQRDAFTCRFCGKCSLETELEVDHLLPRSKGGSDDPSNLAASCRNCNRGKSDRTAFPVTWSTLVGKYFHTYYQADIGGTPIDSPGCGHRFINEQGTVLSDLGSGHFMVQLLSWMGGHESWNGKQIRTLSDMVDGRWTWYANDVEMREAYECSGNPQIRQPAPNTDRPGFRLYTVAELMAESAADTDGEPEDWPQ